MLKMSTCRWLNRSGHGWCLNAVNDADNAVLTRANSYANCEDFCRVFLDNLDSLYRLCLLLTTEHARAEQCLIAGFDECLRSHHVFKDWALPWAKRTLIQE